MHTSDHLSACSKSAHHPKAFTLLELAVLITCAATLALASLPILARTTGRSHQTVDLSHYESLLAAVNLYSNDHHDRLPAPGWGLGVANWASDANYADLTGSQSAAAISNQFVSLKRGQTYPYVNSTAVYFCPLDRTNTALLHALWLGRAVRTTSYIMNGAACEFGRLPGGFSIRQTDIAASDAILLWEPDEMTPFYFNDFSSFPYEGISRRHLIGGIVGNHTGGAEFVSFNQFDQWAGPSGGPVNETPNRLWWAPDTANGR